MFYDHKILTSREHGVAIVWLVATLGSKSSTKKVTRKAILDVDVPKACGTISNPEAPMALRLQGSLLYGVSRVFSQQCGYVLADTQSFRDKMRGIVVVMKELEVDPDAGKARPDQLNLPDDPAFLPDLDMNFDLSPFDISTDTSRRSSLLSPPSLLSSRSSHVEEAAQEPGLALPSAGFSSGGPPLGFGFAGDTSSAVKAGSRVDRPSIFEDTGLIEDPGFGFDEEGNMVMIPAATERPDGEETAASARGRESRVTTDSGIGTTLEQQLAEALYEGDTARGFDIDEGALLPLGDDDVPLPVAAPFSPRRGPPAQPADQLRLSSPARPEEEEETSSTAEAPQKQRRTRVPQKVQADPRQELLNRELAQWNTNYLQNMEEATRVKQQHKATTLAKKNAAYWVLGQGIGGVGAGIGREGVPGPLEMFSGQALLAALTGRDLSPPGSKHARSPSGDLDEEEEARRIRVRTDDEEQLRQGNESAAQPTMEDEGMVMGADDTEMEMGRVAPPSLPDHSSQMPWNISASRYGSVLPFGSAFRGISSSVGGLAGGVDLGPLSGLGRRGSRLTSASPLLGRGGPMPRTGSLDIPGPHQPTTTSDDAEMPLGVEAEDDPAFELYGPAGKVSTQTTAQSHWTAATLDTEAHNFLTFLAEEIQAKGEEAEEEDDDEEGAAMTRTATFEELLPPTEHTKVVAAQAMLHVLALATKGLIEVRQPEAFGEIELSIVGGVGGAGQE